MVKGTKNIWSDYEQVIPELMIFYKMNNGWLECKCGNPELTDSAVIYSEIGLKNLILKYFGIRVDFSDYGYKSVVAFVPNQRNGYEELMKMFTGKPVAKNPSYALHIIKNNQDAIAAKYAQL